MVTTVLPIFRCPDRPRRCPDRHGRRLPRQPVWRHGSRRLVPKRTSAVGSTAASLTPQGPTAPTSCAAMRSRASPRWDDPIRAPVGSRSPNSACGRWRSFTDVAGRNDALFRSELASRVRTRERVSRSANVRQRSREHGPSCRLWPKTETKVRVRILFRTTSTSGSPCQRSGGCGIRTREGLHPTRFPSERHRPLGESSARNLTGKANRRRTQSAA